MSQNWQRCVGQTDVQWLLAACLCGVLLRGVSLSRLAVEHYDEGVYASNLVMTAEEGGQFPARPLFAPPLWPFVLECHGMVGTLLADPLPRWWTMLPGIACGVALIPSIWWLGRRWFGPTAGVLAAWLVALSEFHAFYSRTALTDAPLLLAWTWAVGVIGITLEQNRLRTACAAGGLTALAWWTKYNGWLPIAIGVSGGLAAQCCLPAAERSVARLLRTLSVITGVAVVLWLPVWWDCQSVGGYAAVAANHLGYLEPWTNWFANFAHQGRNLQAYVGGPTLAAGLIGLGLLTIAGLIQTPSSATESRPRPRIVSEIFVGLALVLLATCVSALTALLTGSLFGIAIGLVRWRQGKLSRGEMIAACVFSAWLLGLLLATPRYRAYPRLLLPLWLAGQLGCAWLLAQLGTRWCGSDPLTSLGERAHRWLLAAAVACAIAAMSLCPTRVWEDRTALASAADRIAKEVATSSVVYVYGEPAVFLRLREQGIAAVPAAHFKFVEHPLPVDTYFVPGLFAERDAAFVDDWQRVQARFEAVQTFPVQPSTLVLLDQATSVVTGAERTRHLTLYRLRP